MTSEPAVLAQQVQDRVDTVLVAVPQAMDSLAVRVMSLPDTVHAVVRDVGGEWQTYGTLALTAVLVLVTAWAHVQMHALQKRNTELQADQAKLQREFNEMQAQHEAERRGSEADRAKAQRRAVDARISATAYAVRRQLRSWLDEAPDELNHTVEIVDVWNDAAKQLGNDDEGDVPGVTHGMLEVARRWAATRSGGHFAQAEARMLQLVAVAPEASSTVARAVRRALVVFYDATGRMNRHSAPSGSSDQAARELVRAYHELEACLKYLDAAVHLGTGRRVRKA